MGFGSEDNILNNSMNSQQPTSGTPYNGTVIGGMISSLNLARPLQENMPEIAKEYIEGSSRREIAEHHDISEVYGVSPQVAIRAVGHAIRGYEGGLEVNEFPGLIRDKETLDAICEQHKSDALSNNRAQAFRNGIGRMTHEEQTEARRKGGKTSIENQGYIPWSNDECEAAYELSLLPEYRNSKGVNHNSLKGIINELFHDGQPVRTYNSIRSSVLFTKKSKQKSVSEQINTQV